MPVSQAQLRAMLAAEMPQGSTTLANWSALTQEAIKNAVSYAADVRSVREKVQTVLVGDNATTRFALLGANVDILPDDQQQSLVNVDVANLAAPALAPTIIANNGAGGGTYPAGLYYFAYAYTVGGRETQISPYGSATLTATGAFTLPLVVLPSGVTGLVWYGAPSAYNPDIRTLYSASSGASYQTLNPAPATGTVPLADGANLYALAPDLRLEPEIGPDGRTLPGYTTIQLGNAPALGQRVPVLYYRSPILPANDTDLIGLPDRYMRITTQMFMHQLLAINHTAGDATIHEEAFKDLDPLVLTVMDAGLGPRASEMIPPRW